MAGSWWKLQNVFHKFRSSHNIIKVIKPRRIRRAGHVVGKVKMRNTNNILVVKLKGKKPVGRSRCRCKDNNKMYLEKIVYGEETVYRHTFLCLSCRTD
jgi:hypothetical protein